MFSLILKKLRKSCPLTSTQIKNWETNRHQPDINTLILLTSYFYVSVSVLVSYQNEFEIEQKKGIECTSPFYTFFAMILIYKIENSHLYYIFSNFDFE